MLSNLLKGRRGDKKKRPYYLGATVPVRPPPSPRHFPPSYQEGGAMKIPCRPELGTLGVRVGVKTNNFRVVVSSEQFEVYRYVVSFSPECTLGKLRRKIIDKLEGCYAESGISMYYDGEGHLFTKKPLNFQYKKFNVKLHKKMRGKFIISLELDPLEPIIDGELPSDVLRAIEVVLAKKPSQSHEVVGKSFYDPSWSLRKDLGCGVDCWSGFTQSLRPTQMGLSLIIDKCAESFFKPIGVFEYVKTLYSFESGWPLPDMLIRKIARTLDGVRIQTTHDKFPKSYDISGVSQQPLSDLKFGNVKATEYFLGKHNVVIQYPSMPALQTNQVGKTPFYVPMELCQIVDCQQYTKRLAGSQISGLSKITNQIPLEKEEDFKKVVQEYYSSQTGVYGPGIEIGSEFAFVEARVLPAPLLKYYEKAKEILIPHTDGERDPADLFKFFESKKVTLVQPTDGKWDMANLNVARAAKVQRWACVNFSKAELTEVYNFRQELIFACRYKGIEIELEPQFECSVDAGEIENWMHNYFPLSKHCIDVPEILLVILPYANDSYDVDEFYGRVKRAFEIKLGILTQCCRPEDAFKCKKDYMESLALKINVKVGGQNFVVQNVLCRQMPIVVSQNCPTIIFGADIYRPYSADNAGPSIAAVVASIDWPEISKFGVEFSVQPPREQTIQNLHRTNCYEQDCFEEDEFFLGIIREHISRFTKSNDGQIPATVVFYRNWINNEQYHQVLQDEIMMIKTACASVMHNNPPKLTYVVVQEGHNTRLFNSLGGNVTAGTVIDTQICHPKGFDFYLCSHSESEGSSCPTHYHVLYDDNGFQADRLQLMTNTLCYMNATSTHSISLVAPVNYARLAAKRARHYLNGASRPAEASDTGFRHLSVHKKLKDTMFFC